MFSTICFHVVIENSMRPVKIILYFNRGPPGQNGMLQSPPVMPIRHNCKKHKRQKAKNQKQIEKCYRYAKLRQKPNRGCQLKPQRTLNDCIAKGFTPHRTKVGVSVPMGT
ncbi:hypothetical protein C0J52_08961 [Blattella germanica]|nr:hypothetical protein C0J52_08961 [Blattella germanica]